MKTCLGCGSTLTKRHQQTYCSVACQQRLKQSQLVAEWLATGVGKAQTERGHYIRRHILDEQGGQCAICGCDGVWHELPLALVLDHIDGDASNNRRDNLRLICPNCDSQLPTYKSRNRGRGRAWRKQRYAEGKSY